MMEFLLSHLLAAFTILVWNMGVGLFIWAAAGYATHLENRFINKRGVPRIVLTRTNYESSGVTGPEYI